jgi:hypothetical protein
LKEALTHPEKPEAYKDFAERVLVIEHGKEYRR